MNTPENVPAPEPQPAPAVPPPPPAPPKKKRWKKIIGITGGVIVGLIVLVLLIGPTVISSVAMSKIPAIVGEQLQATATVGSISFSWSGHLELNDFRLVPKNFKDPLIEVKKVDVKIDVGSALGGKYIANVDIVAPKVIVEKGADNKFNYDFPLPPDDKPKSPDSAKPYVQAHLSIREGEVTIRGKGRETVYHNLQLDAKVDTLEKPITYGLSIEEASKGQLTAKGTFDINTRSGPAGVTLDRFSLKNMTGAARAYSDVVELDGTLSGNLDYEIKGAPRFSGKGSLSVSNFSAVLHDPILKVDQNIKLDHLSFTHEGGVDEKGDGKHKIAISAGKALKVDIVADVKDAFNARVVKTDIKVDTDLAALEKILADAGTLPKGMSLAGTISLSGTCDSKGPSQADLDAKKMRLFAKADLNLVGANLNIVKDGKPIKLDRFSGRLVGGIDESGLSKNTITLESGKALSATMQVDVTDAMGKVPGVKADLKVLSDLGELGRMLEKMIGLKADMALEGAGTLKGTVEAKGADSAKADLELSVANLVAVDTKDKKRYEIDPAIVMKLQGGWDGKTKTATADVLKLSSSFATMEGKGGAALAGENPEIRETKIQIDADLEKLAGKLKSFMENPPKLGGKATMNATALGEKIGVVADLKGLRYEKYGPFDLSLKHDGTLDANGNGKHTIRMESGKALGVVVTAELKDAYKDTRAAQVDFKMESDLAALSTMLPGVIELKPGATLTGTMAATGQATTKGSTWAKFDVSANLDNLAALEKGKSQEIDKAIRMKAAGLWDGKKQAVAIDTFTLTSAFATADAKGGLSLATPMSVQESSFQLKADLEKLGAKLGLFMADAPSLAGSVVANASYAGDKYNLDATAKGVKIVREGKTTGPIDATVAQKGTFSMAKDGVFKIETGVVTSSAVDLKLSGEIRKVMDDAREGEIKLEALARPVELSKWMPDLGMGGPDIKATTTVSMKPKLITVVGSTKIDGLTMKSKDVTKTAKTGPFDFTVTMKDKDILATLKTAAFEWIDAGYAAKGGLEAQVTVNEKESTGKTLLSNLEVTDDQKNVVKDPGVTITHTIGFSDSYTTIELKSVNVASSFLKGDLTGRILHADTAPEFQKLHGRFAYIPDRLTAVAKPWLPGKLEGKEEKFVDFTLDGKASSASTLPILRGTQGGMDLDLAKFSMDNGLTVVGKSRLDLKDGKMLSTTPLSVNKGHTDLNVSLDFNEAARNPKSTFTFNAKDVDANGRMAPFLEKINPIFHTSGLDAKVDGQIQSDFKLLWNGPIDPAEKDWTAAAAKAMSGSGVFSMKDLNIAGSPAVGQIMSAIGLGNAISGELIATEIKIADGRCSYDNMVLRGTRKTPEALKKDLEKLDAERKQLEEERPKMKPGDVQKRLDELKVKDENMQYRYVLRFSGYVKFNKEMQLRVLMPMSESMAAANPSLTKYIGTSFWVDLTGTVDHPTLDVKKMLGEAIKRAAEGVLVDKATDLIGGLFKKKDPKEVEAERMYGDAQKAEAAKKNADAVALYRKLLASYPETEFVTKNKKAIEDRIQKLPVK